jgi:hypothetical protein
LFLNSYQIVAAGSSVEGDPRVVKKKQGKQRRQVCFAELCLFARACGISCPVSLSLHHHAAGDDTMLLLVTSSCQVMLLVTSSCEVTREGIYQGRVARACWHTVTLELFLNPSPSIAFSPLLPPSFSLLSPPPPPPPLPPPPP